MKQRLLKYFIFSFILLFGFNSFGQEQKAKKIKYLHADEHRFDKRIDPEAQMMVGKVSFEHEGTLLSCDSAVFYQAKNIMKAYGNVKINQADTLFMYSNYLEYDGNSKMANAADKVKLIDSKMTLTSDTIRFDRNQQIAYYPAFGKIKDSANTLTSIKGTYYTGPKKFVFTTDVVVTNDKYIMKSNHLVYFTDPKTVYFYGPSTITSEDNYIYCENGFYDTKNEVSNFKKNSFIKYKTQTLAGDSLFYNRNTGFGSASNNIVVNDSTKNLIIKGNYAEHFELKDSTFVTYRAVAINVMEKDSLYMHGDTLMMVKIPNSDYRKLRAFHGVKIFKKDLQGKCDSLSYNESNGILRMMYNPVLWTGKNQLTSDTIIVTNNLETQQLDSLKMINSGFIISRDSIENYNQIKGKNIYGKFKDNELANITVVGNSETIYYARNEAKELIGINKALSSSMFITIKENEINEISFIQDPDAELNPESEMPENVRLLKGFIWRGDERIYKKEDIFNQQENVLPKNATFVSKEVKSTPKKQTKVIKKKEVNTEKQNRDTKQRPNRKLNKEKPLI